MYVNTEDRLVTPEEATEGRLPLDSEFYIGKQIATQVDDILSIVGLGCYIRDEWLPVCSALKGVWSPVCTYTTINMA